MAILRWVLLAGWVFWSATLPAQENDALEPEPVHWALSSVFGTGWYQLDNNRSVFVVRIPPRFTFSEAGFDEEGRRAYGFEFHLPFTVGFHRVDAIEDFVDAENYRSLSITPGIEVEIPVTEALALRPFLKAGLGMEFGDGEEAFIWNTGIKGRYRISSARSTWDVLTNLHWAGYDELSGDEDDDIGAVMVGVENRHGLGETRFNANWHASYTWLSPGLEYVEPSRDDGQNELDGYVTLGLALSPRGGPFDFWLYHPHQLGLAVEFDMDGDYLALKFNSRSWFTQ